MPRITISVPGASPQPYRFQLDRHTVTIGRGSNNDIVIDRGSVSVSHAEMRRVRGGYELRDLNSTNGIKIDGERRQVIPLRSGLSMKLGDVGFDFQLSDEECEAIERENAAGEAPVLPESEELPPLRTEKGTGCGSIVWFLILAAVAFCIGMAVRFEKQTGGSWIEAVKTRILEKSGTGSGGE